MINRPNTNKQRLKRHAVFVAGLAAVRCQPPGIYQSAAAEEAQLYIGVADIYCKQHHFASFLPFCLEVNLLTGRHTAGAHIPASTASGTPFVSTVPQRASNIMA